MHRLATAIFLLSSTLPLPAAEPDFPTDQAAARSLDAPDFLLREKAARHLWQSGFAALPLLEKLAAGVGESALRARAIAENIRLGITPETPADLIPLIRSVREDPENDLPIAEALRGPDGADLVLRFIRHQSKSQSENWKNNTARAANFLFESVGDQSPIYQDLLAAIPHSARLTTFYTTLGRGGYPFAYDLFNFSPDPANRPSAERRDRVVKTYRELCESSEAKHLRVSYLTLIGEAERLEGDPSTLPNLLEQFLDGSGDAHHAFAMTNMAFETRHLGQWLEHHAERPAEAPAFVAAVIDQGTLPGWIEKYQFHIRRNPTHLPHLTLAQLHRAHGDHDDAYRVAQSHTAHPTHEAPFAILADDLPRVRELAPEIIAELEDDPFAELKKRIPRFLAHLENPNSEPAYPGYPTPYFRFATRDYRAFVDSVEPEQTLAFAEKIAPISPRLARQLLGGIALESLDRRRGKIGQFLKVKRLLGEEREVVDYISERFGTITSEFWENFLEKQFEDSPLWIMLHIRRRNPDMPRPDLLRIALTDGTHALVPADLEYIFEEVKSSLNSTGRIPFETCDHLAVLYRDPRFSEVAQKIGGWDKSLPEGDRGKGLIEPGNLRFARDPDTADCVRIRWKRFSADIDAAGLASRSELLPSPAALLSVGKNHLGNGQIDEAVRWLTFAGWQALVGQFWKSGEEEDYRVVDGMALHLEIDRSLESALGLEALKKGDLTAAQKRFENLCNMGSMDHRLGSALFRQHLESGDQKSADSLFETRWNRLEAILGHAPRDSEVCRALAAWSAACNHRRPGGAKVYAELATTLVSEQAQQKTYLTRFDW